MKKIIYSALAVALAFFSASCQKENLEPAVSGNTVTYTVEVPGALKTKALGDEVTAVDKVYYEVYRETEVETGQPVYEGNASVSNGQASFELEFVKGQKYVVLFWAQNQNLTMFNIEDLREVTLTTPGASNNVNAQVFAGKDTVSDCVSANGGKVELTRPISQLNIFTTKESLMFGTKSITLIESTVTVKGLYTTYNVAEGEAVTENVEAANFTYGSYAVPATEDADTYAYVAMNYVGFAPEASTTVEVDFTINTSEGNVSHNVSSVPVKPNYRTNIVGNLLTEATDYNVTLNAEWADEEYTEVVVSTASDLQTTVNEAPDGEATEITLSGDIDFGDLLGTLTKAASDPASLVIPATKTIVLNLNGCTLSQTAKQTGAHSMIENNGHLTIVDTKGNGKISYSDTGNGGNYVSNTIINSGTLVIESGLIENNSSAEVAANGYPHPLDNNGELIINGGTLTNNANYASMRIWCTTDDNTSVTINGGTFNGSIDFQTPSASANKGSLTINGGTFNADTYTKCAVRLLGFGADVDEMLGDIKGGTFNGEIALRNWSGSDLNSQVFYITGGKFLVDPTAFVVDGYPVIAEGGYYTIGQFVPVAKIGENEYWSLNAAVAAVQDGETITLVADEKFTMKNYFDNGGWRDGMGYAGDKSFTIDLDGHTIEQDGSLNDYLMWFKNDGAKANTITLKNGTMDAGTTAFCAFCTASSNAQKLTVNLENVTLINNNSNGSVVKVRGGSEVNIKAGTKITGKNSYLGVENWNAVVNIYDGAEIYMNGTASYNGCLVGVGGNGTVNVYGGYGKGVSGGLIAMTSGGTINAMGGEWIANTDGTFANSNKSVLVAQSDKQYNAGAGNAVVNVTGGTYKGGYNCYGNAVGDAQINISGGNFNADPSAYVIPEHKAVENNGVWTIELDPTEVTTWEEFAAALAANKQYVALGADITYASNYQLQKSVNIDLNGKSMTLPMINVHSKATISNGTINGKVYVRMNSDVVFDGVKFSGDVSDNLSTEGHLAIKGGCKLYVKDCLFSPTSVSGSQTRPVSFEGGSSTIKFEGCEFKSSPYKKQVYLNSLSATGSIDFTNCNFNNKTPNIMFAAACPLTNVTMTGTTKLSSVTFEINRAKDAVTADDLAYLRTLISNNSFSSVRVFYAGGSSEYIR